MGEAAYLLRSFSHPSESSLKAEQGDSIRVLGESISFGRFMSESLAWEKWSAFSQNRYLEEVEKFSKPGSVAQKKAYFEAHYKKKALQREANFVDETNAQSATVTPLQTEEKSSPSEHTKEFSGDIVDKGTTMESNLADLGFLPSIDADMDDSPVDRSSAESSQSEEKEEAAILQIKNTKSDEATIEFSKGRNEILESGGEGGRIPSKQRFAVSSLKLGPHIGASKLPPNPAKKPILRPSQMNNALPKSMKPTDNVLKKARLTATAKSLHSSIDFPSGLRKSISAASVSQSISKRRLAASLQQSRPQTGASKLPSDPTAKKTASLPPKDNVLEKARLPAPSSCNLPSGFIKSNMATSFSQSDARTGGQKDTPKPQKTPLKASETGTLKNSSVNTRPNDRRILSQSVSVLDRKLKSSFNVGIEERTLKRKEFFQKLKERAKERDVEKKKKKEQQTRYKNKTAPNSKNIQQSRSVAAKESENHQRRAPFPGTLVRKVAEEAVKSYASNSSNFLPSRSSTKSHWSERLAGENKTTGTKPRLKLWIY